VSRKLFAVLLLLTIAHDAEAKRPREKKRTERQVPPPLLPPQPIATPPAAAQQRAPEPQTQTAPTSPFAAGRAPTAELRAQSLDEPVTAAPRPLIFDIALGAASTTRQLRFNDDLFGRFQPYTLPIAPALWLRGTYFPGAHVTDTAASRIGITIDGRFDGVTATIFTDGSRQPTQAFWLMAGALFRQPLGTRVNLHFAVLAGLHRFAIAVPRARASSEPVVLSTEYWLIEPQIGARVAITARVALEASFGLLGPVRTGALTETYARRAVAFGFDGRFSVAVGLIAGLEARIGAQLVQYTFAARAEPGDTFVLGGGFDQYIHGIAGLAYRY